MKQKRAYQYRIYPTDEQKKTFARTFGCARFVYNWALRLRTDAYYEHQERIYYAETSARLTALKKHPEYAWLNEVAAVPLQQSLRHLDKAFKNFFEGRTEYPTFHSKQGQQAATYIGTAFKWDGHLLTLAKMDEPLHSARPSMTVISTPQKMCWPRGSRCQPAERLSDLGGHMPAQAGLVETGNPSREGRSLSPSGNRGCQFVPLIGQYA